MISAMPRGILSHMKDEFVRETATAKIVATVTHNDLIGYWYKDEKPIAVI